MRLTDKALRPQLDALLRTARCPITSYELAAQVLERKAEPWEWFAIDGVLANLIINGDDAPPMPAHELRRSRGGRFVYRWRKAGAWYYCHVTKKLELGAGEDDTLTRAVQALSAARDDVIGDERTVKRGRPARPQERESVYTMALNY